MDTADLTRAMADATADLSPRPGLAETVVRGARRRRNRRLAGGVLALAAVVGVVTIAIPTADPVSVPAADPLWHRLDHPTRGDLADDKAYLASVRSAWLDGARKSPNLAATPLTGDTRIVWAGTTPVGPAAYVAQRSGEGVALGVVAGTPPVLVSDRPAGLSYSPAFLFGPDDRMLITLDLGEPLRWSRWEQWPEGSGGRSWADVPVVDGVGLVHLPEGAPATAEVHQPGTTTVSLRASDYPLGIDKQSKPIPQRTIDWPRAKAGAADIPSLVDSVLPDQYLADMGYLDREVKALVTGFHGVAALPGGRSVTAFEMVPAVDAGSRFYAVVHSPDDALTGIAGGAPIDLTRPLPARVELPDGDGWVVAQPGASIDYRANAGAQWQPVGSDIALIPAAGEVRVRVAGEQDQIVTFG